MKSKLNVWPLLRRNLSHGQLIGYAVSNIVGLSVVLIGIMFFLDSRHSSGEESDSFFSSDFMVLSKRVDGIGFTPVNFSEEEITELESQPWVKKVGRFESSRFAVQGEVSLGGRGLSTYMFFESVPDEFFDQKPKDWEFDPSKKYVPIILGKDYLTLYNFGFALPQGLPQVSEEIISAIPLTLNLSGEGMRAESFDASIVGFSSRLNTIAVPRSFMDWANERYAPGKAEQPSRLIVEIDRLSAQDMQTYLDARELEISGDKAADGNISRFLSTSSLVVTINGLIISLLAVFILVLSIFLLLQKSRGKLRDLMLLGYSPAFVARRYERLVVTANTVVAVVAVAVALFLRRVWNAPLQEIGLGDASPLPMILIAAGYLIILSGINIIIIRRFMTKIWHQ